MPCRAQPDLPRCCWRLARRCSSYRSLRAGKYREGWAEKFLGRAPLRIGDRPCVWFHAVSVGEVLLLRPILRELARRRPGWEVVDLDDHEDRPGRGPAGPTPTW